MGGAHGAVGFVVQFFQAVERLLFSGRAEDFHLHAEAVLIRRDAAAQVEAPAHEFEYFVIQRVYFSAELFDCRFRARIGHVFFLTVELGKSRGWSFG